MILDYGNLRIYLSDAPKTYKQSLLIKIAHNRDLCMTALREADRQCLIAKEASLNIIELEEGLKLVERVDQICRLHSTGNALILPKKE
jgi:hypothetical protein